METSVSNERYRIHMDEEIERKWNGRHTYNIGSFIMKWRKVGFNNGWKGDFRLTFARQHFILTVYHRYIDVTWGIRD